MKQLTRLTKRDVQRMYPAGVVAAIGTHTITGDILLGYVVKESGTYRAISPYGLVYGRCISSERAVDALINGELERLAH